jgi:hypothetical protein
MLLRDPWEVPPYTGASSAARPEHAIHRGGGGLVQLVAGPVRRSLQVTNHNLIFLQTSPPKCRPDELYAVKFQSIVVKVVKGFYNLRRTPD